jgi:glucose-6-phosphate isomerase
MALKAINPTETEAWKKLAAHFEQVKNVHMHDLFLADPLRAEKMHIEWNDFLVDYSKNRVTDETMSLLLSLAKEVDLADAIQKYFDGDCINQTENRAVLHTALRANGKEAIFVDGVNVMPEITAVKNKINQFSDEIITAKRLGFTGKPFTDVVNIGIGGSDLGPAMIVEG